LKIYIVLTVTSMTTAAATYKVDLVIPDLKNGSIEEITALVPASYIPSEYKWVNIADIPTGMHLKALNSYYKAYYVAMKTAQKSDDDSKFIAKTLAGIRAGMQQAWALTKDDMDPSELASGYLKWIAAKPVTDSSAGSAASVEFAYTGATATSSGMSGHLAAAGDLGDSDKAYVTAMVLLGVVVPPVQGWSLMKTQHHFLSDAGTGARAAQTAVMKQFKTKVTAEVYAAISSRLTLFEDVVFHKSGHPLLMSYKMSLAASKSTREKLLKIGWGSAAIRLPATSPDFEYAKIVAAILTRTKNVLAAVGITVVEKNLTDAIAAVLDQDDPKKRKPLEDTALVIAHMEDAAVAIASGILSFIAEETGSNTIVRAFGFKKLQADYPTEVSTGRNIARAVNQKNRDDIAEGRFQPLEITFGAKRVEPAT